MNRFLLSISTLSLIFCSCDKNKEMDLYTELYHIEGNDTISVIYIPNSFTPDGSGQNDLFYPVLLGISNEGYQLSIYNLYGELFYLSNFSGSKWDGCDRGLICKNGTYHFSIKAKDSTNFVYEYSGVVELKK